MINWRNKKGNGEYAFGAKVVIGVAFFIFCCHWKVDAKCKITPQFIVYAVSCTSVEMHIKPYTTGNLDNAKVDWGDGNVDIGLVESDTFLTHNYTLRASYNVKLVVKDVSACLDSIIVQVSLPSVPKIVFQSLDNCLSEVFDVNSQVNFAASKNLGEVDMFYIYYGDGTSDSSTALDFLKKYQKTGTYALSIDAVQYTRGKGCKDPSISKGTYKVVNPDPVPDFTLPDTVCEGQIFKVNDFTEIDTSKVSDKIKNWNWNFNDGTYFDSPKGDTSHSYKNAGKYKVILTVTSKNGNCTKDTFHYIYVCPKPKIQISFKGGTKCKKQSVQFQNKITKTCCGNFSYFTWDFGDGSIPQKVTDSRDMYHEYQNSGLYNVVVTGYISVKGLSYKTSMGIWINKVPGSIITVSNTCDNLDARFIHQLSLSSDSISSVVWTLGNFDSVATFYQDTFRYAYNAKGSYTATAITISSQGCTDTVTDIHIDVYPSPVAKFSVAATCQNLPVKFIDASSIASPSKIANFSYDFGDSKKSGKPSPLHRYSVAGTYHPVLKLTSEKGCTDTSILSLNVYKVPVADFSMSATTAACTGEEINFTNKTTGTGVARWHWDFSGLDTNGAVNPKYTYYNAGTRTNTLIVTNSNHCSDTLVKDIEILEAPNPDFTLSQSIGCTPMDVIMEVSGPSKYDGYKWYFAKTVIPDSIKLGKTFTTATSSLDYSIVLRDSNQCGIKSTTKRITVSPRPKAVISLYQGKSLFCQKETFTFKSYSTGAPDSLIWYLDGSDIRRKPNSGNNDKDSVIKSLSYHLSSPSTKEYTIRLVAKNGCDQDDDEITVTGQTNDVTAAFELVGNQLYGCVPYTVKLKDKSVNAYKSIQYYLGDGSYQTLNKPGDFFSYQYTKSGRYVINQAIEGCGEDTFIMKDTVVVYELPKAEILNLPSNYCAGNPLTLYASGTSLSKTWYIDTLPDFSHADTFLQSTPEIVFSKPKGKSTWYYVKLNVKRHEKTGPVCESESIDSVLIVPHPKPILTPQLVSGCQPLDTIFLNNSLYASKRVWNLLKYNIDSNRYDTVSNSTLYDQFKYSFRSTTNNVEKYRLWLTINNNVCSDTISAHIRIYPQPLSKSNFLLLDSNIRNCNSGKTMDVKFYNTSDRANEYLWNFGDGDSSIAKEPIHTYKVNKSRLRDSFLVSLKAINTYGCIHYSYNTVIILAQPKLKVDTVIRKICQGDTLSYYPETVEPKARYTWKLYQGKSVYLDTGRVVKKVMTLQKPLGSVESELWGMRLFVSFPNGCNDSLNDSTFTKVYHLPDPHFVFFKQDTLDNDCYPGGKKRIILNSDSSTNSHAFIWNFSNGIHSVKPNPSTTFQLPFGNVHDSFKVTLVATNSLGCKDSIHKYVEVRGRPSPDFNSDRRLLCETDTACFQPSVDDPVAKYIWRFTNKDAIKNDSICYPVRIQSSSDTIEYEFLGVKLVAYYPTTHCRDSLFIDSVIKIYQLPESHFFSTIDNPSIDGCYPNGSKTVSFDAKGSFNTAQHHWDFGDGILASNKEFIKTYRLDTGIIVQNFQVIHTAINVIGCTDTTKETINVKRRPTIRFNNTKPVRICEDSLACFKPGDWYDGAKYTWETTNGDPFYDQFSNKRNFCSRLHFGDTSGKVFKSFFQVKLITTLPNECIDSFIADSQLIIFQRPKINFSYERLDTASDHCYDKGRVQVSFNSGASANTSETIWRFGDGKGSLQANPLHVFKLGTDTIDHIFQISLEARNALGCASSGSTSIRIKSNPKVDFNRVVISECEKKPICLEPDPAVMTARVVSYLWKFRDGKKGYDRDFCRSFETVDPLRYVSVTLVMGLDNGCIDSLVRDSHIIIRKKPVADFETLDLLTNPYGEPVPHGRVRFVDRSVTLGDTSEIENHWIIADSGLGSTLELDNVFTFQQLFKVNGKYPATLMIYDRNGCSDTVEKITEPEFFGGLFVPNALAPEVGIGEAAIFLPKGIGLKSYSLQIYDQNWRLLFETSELDSNGSPVEGWDGRLKGEYLPQGAYYWNIKALFLNGEVWAGNKQGHLRRTSGKLFIVR